MITANINNALARTPPSYQQTKGVVLRHTPIKKSDAAMRDDHALRPSANLRMKYQIHKGTRTLIARLVDEKRGLVVNEIPNEHILDLAERLGETFGSLVDVEV